MKENSVKEIMEMIVEEDVEFIRLQFTAMDGTLKNIAVTASQAELLKGGRFPIDRKAVSGSEAKGRVYLRPDINTFAILPWRPQQGKVARLICDVEEEDKSSCVLSSRYILKMVREEARKQGYILYTGHECEFFLFHTDDNGTPTTITHEKAGYLDLNPVDFGENARRDMVLSLEDMGLEIEASYHEEAPAQHEIDFKYKEALEAADQVITFKTAVRSIAKRHGLHATFMPKPRTGINGSGMHINMMLFHNGKNVFFHKNGKLNDDAYYFIGGILKHVKGMAVFTNPLVNSYKRLVPGFQAPAAESWTEDDNPIIQILSQQKEAGLGIELCSPDAAANPYLVSAVCLAAGLEGIKERIRPEHCKLKENQVVNIGRNLLPENLKEAVKAFRKDDFFKNVLGTEFCRQYGEIKEKEWQVYAAQVSSWEVEEYLYRF